MTKRWVYRQGNKWAVRRKDKNRKMITYGAYYDKRIACLVRDMLIMYGFYPDNMVWVEDLAITSINNMDNYKSSMFGRVSLEDIEYLETCELTDYDRYLKPTGTNDKYSITRSIRNKSIYFGTYSFEKGKEVIDFLNDNNWDKELLQIMQEMGEI